MSEYKVVQWDGKSKTLKSIIPIENAVKPSSLSTETGALVVHINRFKGRFSRCVHWF